MCSVHLLFTTESAAEKNKMIRPVTIYTPASFLPQSCKAFIGLTIRLKMIGRGDPIYLKFWVKLTALEQNRRFSIYFREKVQLTLVGSQLRTFQ